MPRAPKSKARKAQENQLERDELYARAKELYQCEHKGDHLAELGNQGNTTRSRGFRTICNEVTNMHYRKTGKVISLSSSTLRRHVYGGKTLSESNAEKSHLTNEEAENLIEFTIDMAKRGFPFTTEHLRKRAQEIVQDRQQIEQFIIGQNWADRFVTKHSDRLKKYMSRGLDAKRARAVNPVLHASWFEMLGETIRKYNISDDCTFGSDETGFLLRELTSDKVIGPVGEKIIYEVGEENREQVTAICTICADGTALPPLVIFKGTCFFVKWGEDNPLNCSYVKSLFSIQPNHH